MNGVSILFFLSGVIGLLYEVLWAKYLGLVLGSTAVAHTFVLSMFMGGLALGNTTLGPRADGHENPLRLYGELELGAAVWGLASPLLLRLCGWPSALWAQGLLCALTLVPPTILMGGTLPALSRLAVRDLAQMQTAVARLYFWNSAGAVLGALAAGFLLIPALGLDRSVACAAALNLAVAAGALRASRSLARAPAAPAAKAGGGKRRPPAEAAPSSAALRDAVLLATFFSGFVALSYEIAWIRLLSMVLGSSAYSFSLMLAAFIAGITLGSLVVARGWHPRASAAALFGWTQVGIGVLVAATMPFYDKLCWLAALMDKAAPRTPAGFYLFEGAQWGMCFLLMLPPTLLLGMSLPLASRAWTNGAEKVGRSVGFVFGVNTLGNVLGALLSGLWLLPALGLQGLIEGGVGLNFAAAALVFSRSGERVGRRLTAVLAAGVLAFAGMRAGSLDRALLANGVFRSSFLWKDLSTFSYGNFRRAAHDAPLLFYKDDRDMTVAAFQHGKNRSLNVNGKTDASTAGDMPTQTLLAHIPLLLHPAPKDVLIIGLGSGTTAGSALLHPIARLVVAEISGAVRDASRFFEGVNGKPLADPRTRLVLQDGKRVLGADKTSFDVIISEPSNPWIAGVGNLFSEDFYRCAVARMRPGGIMAQWFHLYEMDDRTLSMIVRTFAAVFPHVSAWQTMGSDLILIGSSEAHAPDFDRVAAAFGSPRLAADFRRIGITKPATLLSAQMMDDDALRRMAGPGPLNADFFPRLEYMAPKAFFYSKRSGLADAWDQRRDPRGAESLALGRFLRRRGRALERGEILELDAFYSTSSAPFVDAALAERLRSHPEDLEVRTHLAQRSVDDGRTAAGWELLKAIPEAKCVDLDCAFLRARIAPEPAVREAAWQKLLTTPGSDRAGAYIELARLKMDKDYPAAMALYEKAAELSSAPAGRERAAAIWAEAVLVAIRSGDPDGALRCARRARASNPEDDAVRALVEKGEQAVALLGASR